MCGRACAKYSVLGLMLLFAANASAGTLACDQIFSSRFESAPVGPLVAEAGQDIDGSPAAPIALQGSAVGEAGPINYCWTLSKRPAGSDATLLDAETAQAQLIPDQAGEYRVRLVVDNGQYLGAPDTVTVSTATESQVIGAAGGQVLSTDRQLRLEIPAGALDEDTSISIRRVRSADIPSEWQGESPLAAYEMSPSGLSFNTPAKLTVVRSPLLGAQDLEPLAIASMSGGEMELLPSVENRMSDSQMEVSGDVSHFSFIGLLRLRDVSVIRDSSVVALSGQTFTESFTVMTAPAATVSVSTDVAPPLDVGPIDTDPDLADPLLGSLVHGDLISITTGGSTDTGSFSGQCLRGGLGEVRLRLTVEYSGFGSVPGLILRPFSIDLVYSVACFALDLPTLPAARDDRVTPPPASGVVTIPVLANDITTGTLVPSVTVTRPPLFGSTFVNLDGSVRYTANSTLRLFDSFEYRFRTSGGLNSNTATVFLTPFATMNSAPTAVDDTASTGADEAVVIPVLLNDVDSDGVLDPSTLALNTTTTQGSAVANADGTVSYTPPLGVTGTDTFAYTVSDDDGAVSNSATATITIVAAGAPPTAVNDNLFANADETELLDVLANDTGDIDPASLAISQAPNLGQAEVVLTQIGKGLNPGPGDLSAQVAYTPAAGFIGDDFFSYSIADPTGSITRMALVRVTVVPADNEPPVAVDDAVTIEPNTPVTIFVTMNDFDVDSLLDAGSEMVVSPPSNGTVGDGGFGAFLYTPNTGFIGVDTFTYTVADAFGAVSNEATVEVTVTPPGNQPPVAQNDTFAIGIDSPPLALDLLANDDDPDGALDRESVVLSSLPTAGVEISFAGNGRVQIVPETGFVGEVSFSYTVTDGVATSNVADVSITVRTFLGLDPTNNISAANTIFASFFGTSLIDQGTGASVGVSHNEDSGGSTIFIDDYTVYFAPSIALVRSDPAVDDVIDFDTGLQQFMAEYNSQVRRWAFPDIMNGPVFSEQGPDMLSVSSKNVSEFQVAAPAPIRNPDGSFKDLFGAFDGLATPIRIPADAEATHFLLRVFGINQNTGGFSGITVRVPISEIPIAPDGTRTRPLLTPVARSFLAATGFRAEFSALVVLYNQVDNTAFFDFPGAQPVPLAAGRGFLFPAEQLNPVPDQCADVKPFTLCQGGPNLRLLATNQNGTIDVFDSENGDFLFNLVGDSIPNFLVDSGWQAIQDPRTNCLLVSDSGDIFGGSIHQYNTDGTVVQGDFISLPDESVRGIALRNGNLLAAIHDVGEVREYDTVTGEQIRVVASDLTRPNSIYVDATDNLIITDQGPSGFNDLVYLYPRDGGDRRVILGGAGDVGGGLATPYQVARLQNGNLGLAHFGGAAIRVFQDGFPLISNLVLDLNPNNMDAYQVRGVWPLANGTFLVTADNGGGVSIFDPLDVAGGGVNVLRNGSTYRFIGTACMN